MNNRVRLGRLLIGLGLWTALGCSGRKLPPSCTTSAGTSDFRVNATAIVGGFVRFGDKRCTATFEVERVNGGFEANVWTAAHCTGYFSVLAGDVLVDIYESGGYVQSIPAKDKFSEAMRVAQSEANRLGSDAAKVMERSIDVMHAFQSGTANSQTFASDCATKVSQWATFDGQTWQSGNEEGNHLVCASFRDMGLYRISFGPGLSSEQQQVLDIASRRELRRKELLASQRSARTAELTRWREAMESRWLLTRERTNAFFVDWLALCDGTLSGPTVGVCTDCGDMLSGISGTNATTTQGSVFQLTNAASELENQDIYRRACAKKAELTTIAERYLVPGSESIIAAARDQGFPNAEKGYFEDFKARELEDAEKELVTKWNALRSWVLQDRERLYAINNVIVLDSQNRAMNRFGAFPLSTFTRDAAQATLVPTTSGFEIQIPASVSRAVSFAPGDSGTVFAFDGLFPTVAVNSVDGRNSSGGVTYLPLPERRSTTTAVSTTTTAQVSQPVGPTVSTQTLPGATTTSTGPVGPTSSPVVSRPTGTTPVTSTQTSPTSPTQSTQTAPAARPVASADFGALSAPSVHVSGDIPGPRRAGCN